MTASVRLVATDLDGTLFGPEATVSPRTAAAVAAAHAAGIVVVAATGRSHRTAVPRLAPAPAVEHLVCSNGAVVYAVASCSVLVHRPLEGPVLAQAFGGLADGLAGCCFGWETPDGFGWEEGFLALDGILIDVTGSPMPVADRPASVTKLMVGHPELRSSDLLGAVAPLLGEGVTVTSSGAAFVEVTAAGVDKAVGLAALAAELGVDRGAVLAIGDNLNDLPMLRWAGRSVAMANAHPDVLGATDGCTASNADDGVAQVLEQLVAAGGTW